MGLKGGVWWGIGVVGYLHIVVVVTVGSYWGLGCLPNVVAMVTVGSYWGIG